ncbi:MAG: hypothetical protein NZM08_03280, partial [Chitinophagales bacterium]|nr:hypothetical protein [Chitinophagales bacterium]
MKYKLLPLAVLLFSAMTLQAQNVNIGSSTYPTLTAAVADINAGIHTGAIVVDVVASTTEPGPVVLNSSGAGAAFYTSVLIRPVNDGLTISGATATGRGLIELNGADNVTIDGDNPNTAGINRNLTIQNTAASTITYTSCIRVATSTLVTTANNITLRNLIIRGSATGRFISSATSTTGSENTTFGITNMGGASTTSATAAPTALSSL